MNADATARQSDLSQCLASMYGEQGVVATCGLLARTLGIVR